MSFNASPEPTARQYPVHYRITISGAPADGFIDHLSSVYYADSAPLADKAASLNIERSNLRYEALIRSLSENATIAVTAYDLEEGEGSVYGMTVVYDRPDYIYAYAENGTLITDPEDSITRQIEKALANDITQVRTVLVPVTGDDYTHSTELVTAEALTGLDIVVELLDLIKAPV